MPWSTPKPEFQWVTQASPPAAVAKLARVLREVDPSVDREKQRWASEFRRGRKRAGWWTLAGLLVYAAYYWGTKSFVFSAYEDSTEIHVLPLAFALSFLPLAWLVIARPFFAFIAHHNRLSSLSITISGVEFLTTVERERRPFVLYLRDFRSWSAPRFIFGGLASKDPLVRELSWILPEGVSLVCMHNVSEAATRADNIIHIQATNDTWEAIARSACDFAALIVVAPRDSTGSLKIECEWISNSRSLQRKALLLLDPLADSSIKSMQPVVRWTGTMWRPPSGENATGLGELPASLELVKYT